jgi:CheY-like chemotaxis protein
MRLMSSSAAVKRSTASNPFRPEVVLLDIGLPTMNGYELAGRLRAMPQLKGLRLVALSKWCA